MAGSIHRGTRQYPGLAGDFHRPYENSKTVSFYHSTEYSLKSQVTGDFHRPYENFHFTVCPCGGAGGHFIRVEEIQWN